MSVAVRPAAGLALAAVLLACSLVTAAPARAAACPGADATGGPASARAAAVVCLTAQARRRAHRAALRGADALRRSAALKVDSIERCGTFTHTPCGNQDDLPDEPHRLRARLLHGRREPRVGRASG